jgi:hypothetical protein
VLAAVVVALLMRFRPYVRRRRRREEDPLTLTETEITRDAQTWAEEAERLERAGEWKAALRCRFRVLIDELIERAIVRDLPGRTSGEFRADVRRAAPELSGAFAEASYLFDDAWYGDRPTGPSENAAFRQLSDRVLAGAREARAPVGVAADGGQP